MSRHLLLLGTILAACTAHAPDMEQSNESLIIRLRAMYEFSTMSEEEKRAFEDRAKLRERQRKQGLRVCEEGEHGTKWREDCKVCQCEHGLRTCPAVKCHHKPGNRLLPPPNRR